MSFIRGKMTPIELIKLAQDRIAYVRKSEYLAVDIRSSCEGLYLDDAIRFLDEVISGIELMCGNDVNVEIEVKKIGRLDATFTSK